MRRRGSTPPPPLCGHGVSRVASAVRDRRLAFTRRAQPRPAGGAGWGCWRNLAIVHSSLGRRQRGPPPLLACCSAAPVQASSSHRARKNSRRPRSSDGNSCGLTKRRTSSRACFQPSGATRPLARSRRTMYATAGEKASLSGAGNSRPRRWRVAGAETTECPDCKDSIRPKTLLCAEGPIVPFTLKTYSHRTCTDTPSPRSRRGRTRPWGRSPAARGRNCCSRSSPTGTNGPACRCRATCRSATGARCSRGNG